MDGVTCACVSPSCERSRNDDDNAMTNSPPDDARRQSISSIKRYFAEELDQDIGELKAGLLLNFMSKEISRGGSTRCRHLRSSISTRHRVCGDMLKRSSPPR